MKVSAHIGSSSELPPVIVSGSSVHETFDASVEKIHAGVGASVSELLKNSGIVFASQQTAKPIHISTEGKDPEGMIH